ncbi:MAG: hypothetical protein Q8830_03505, partial [Candidatus Phytoplasma australasiaticum]|nr:hypothetical protein [Candidatus Phytoplasma australasiaticum]
EVFDDTARERRTFLQVFRVRSRPLRGCQVREERTRMSMREKEVSMMMGRDWTCGTGNMAGIFDRFSGIKVLLLQLKKKMEMKGEMGLCVKRRKKRIRGA